jgi:peptide/nickel transport system permease protein
MKTINLLKIFSSPTFRLFIKKRSIKISLFILILMAFSAIFADYIAPEGYNSQQLPNRFQPPSLKHPLGTDYLGRSILSRAIYGSRIIFYIAIVCLGISTSIGVLLGLASGFIGGLVDNFLMRATDIMLAFPTILLGIAILAVIGPGLENAIIAVAISAIAPYIRLVRGQVLAEREQLYVESSKALGASTWHIIFRHILGNILSPIVVQSAFTVANSIVMVASFGFIGIGANPPIPDWGAMLYEMRPYLRYAPINSIIPGIFIFAVVFSFNALGEELRRSLDPRRRKGIVEIKL